MSECVESQCRHHDPLRGCKVVDHDFCWQRYGCGWGRFVTFVTNRFGYLGKWTFKRVTSYNDVIVATLTGDGGKVEVWGGDSHKGEVWAFPKGSHGSLVSTVVNSVSVLAACKRVGIQERLGGFDDAPEMG